MNYFQKLKKNVIKKLGSQNQRIFTKMLNIKWSGPYFSKWFLPWRILYLPPLILEVKRVIMLESWCYSNMWHFALPPVALLIACIAYINCVYIKYIMTECVNTELKVHNIALKYFNVIYIYICCVHMYVGKCNRRKSVGKYEDPLFAYRMQGIDSAYL